MGMCEVSQETKLSIFDEIALSARKRVACDYWVYEDWEPYKRCRTDEEKASLIALTEWFTAASNRLKHLGALAVCFEKCHPARQITMAGEGDDEGFYLKRLRPELLEEVYGNDRDQGTDEECLSN
jgi:hypothetical protein